MNTDVKKFVENAGQGTPLEVLIQMRCAETADQANAILTEYRETETQAADVLQELEFASRHYTGGVRDLIIRASEIIRKQKKSITRLRAVNAGHIDLVLRDRSDNAD